VPKFGSGYQVPPTWGRSTMNSIEFAGGMEFW
jgi:hypothetical protein